MITIITIIIIIEKNTSTRRNERPPPPSSPSSDLNPSPFLPFTQFSVEFHSQSHVHNLLNSKKMLW